MGVSEANIETNVDPSHTLIQGYNMIKSEGNIARICVFYKSDLDVKILDRKLGSLAAVWIEVGTRNNNGWYVTSLESINYYK